MLMTAAEAGRTGAVVVGGAGRDAAGPDRSVVKRANHHAAGSFSPHKRSSRLALASTRAN